MLDEFYYDINLSYKEQGNFNNTIYIGIVPSVESIHSEYRKFSDAQQFGSKFKTHVWVSENMLYVATGTEELTSLKERQLGAYAAVEAQKRAGDKEVHLLVESFAYLNMQQFFAGMNDAWFQKGAKNLNVTFVNKKLPLEEMQAEAMAQNMFKRLISAPSNIKSPKDMHNLVSAIPAKHAASNIAEVTCIEGIHLERGYPLVAAVGNSSNRKPVITTAIYKGDLNSSEFELAFIGKGCTFDTGGVHIKPDNFPDLMKKDMGGSALGIALFNYLCQTKTKINVVFVFAFADNMTGGASMKPGDVYKSACGITVEIGNTDAEGRLLLADSMVAVQKFHVKRVMTAATLTGATKYIGGNTAFPCFVWEDYALLEFLENQEEKLQEGFLPMPVFDECYDKLKENSTIADYNNIASGCLAGSSVAAAFLHIFAKTVFGDDVQFSHYDISNVAMAPGFGICGTAPKAGMGTGRPIRTFIEMFRKPNCL